MLIPLLGSTITEVFLKRVKQTPQAIGFQYKPTYSEQGPLGQWKKITYKEFYHECRLVSFGLMEIGIRPRDKVALLAGTRFEWSLCDMAILGAGAVSVPIYSSHRADEVAFILDHSDARVVVAEDTAQLQKIFEKKAESPELFSKLEKIIVLEPKAMSFAARYPQELKHVLTLQALKELGRRKESRDPAAFDRFLESTQPQDLFTICYTSGTTGIPKGVMLTHDNLMSVMEDCASLFSPHLSDKKEVVLSFLPFSHVLGRIESLAGYVFGWRAVFAESLDKLNANLIEIKPTLLFAVPRVFEKAHHRFDTMIEREDRVRRRAIHWARSEMRHYFERKRARKRIPLWEWAQIKIAKKAVLEMVTRRFGGRLKFAVCGGAALQKEIGEFFQEIGITIIEGYGLTETCAPVTLNDPREPHFGTVGKPLPEVMVKVDEDGEILIKSRKLFHSYYKDTDSAASSFSKGWFRTGDLGHIDSEGYIHITDRKKELIVTSGGKNIAPQKIENIASGQKYINQFVVIGNDKHYLTALVTLEKEVIMKYANQNQILYSEYGELIKNPKILSLVQKDIDRVNQQLASFETIKKFVILPSELTVEGGELTPSLKVRRTRVNEKYSHEIESLYH